MTRRTRLATGLTLWICMATGGRSATLTCDSSPPGAPAFSVELLTPTVGGRVDECELEIVGRVLLEDRRAHDVYLVVDSSGSTLGASGLDLDGDGLVGAGDWRSNTDPADSTLEAELEAVRRALDAWEGLDVRVALEEYSAVIPIPPGEADEQGRIRTVQGLTSDFDAVRAGLQRIAADGSVGATDYGGALLELAAEFDRSGDPARRPVAFFLSDGKPTFPRYPYDATESADVEWALEGARAVADRDLPANALEIGTFDDIGVLAEVARLTGGTLLPGLTGSDILDAIARLALDGFVFVRLENRSTGEQTLASLDAQGRFEATIELQDGPNEITFTALLRTPDGEWTISCPIELSASCDRVAFEPPETLLPEPEAPLRRRTPFLPRGRRPAHVVEVADRGEVDGTVGDGEVGTHGRVVDRGAEGAWGSLRPRVATPRPQTRDRLGRWGIEPCEGLEGRGGRGADCDEALRQLTALLLSIEVGELSETCPLDPDAIARHDDVGELIAELETAIEREQQGRCANAAADAELVTGGAGLADPIVGPEPTGGASFDCTVVTDSADLDVTVELVAPPPGMPVGEGGECDAVLRLLGESSARGNTAYDVYFVVDSSGSTAGDSGRDADGDGTNETTLDAELAAVRALVELLDPSLVRVALIEFSAVIPIPPGEPSEQGRIRTVFPLGADFDALFAAMDTIRTDGSVGATDYGGALMELAAEFDRNGDPARGHVAFFLSDGKPTFPRFPYDSTEPQDVAHALAGADACAERGIVVNTFELGVFDDLSTLLDVAGRTGGQHRSQLEPGEILDTLPGSTLVGIARVDVLNELTGESRRARLAPDGAWEVDLDLAQGENEIVITVTADGGAEVVECRTAFTGDCTLPRCEVHPPEAWRSADCP